MITVALAGPIPGIRVSSRGSWVRASLASFKKSPVSSRAMSRAEWSLRPVPIKMASSSVMLRASGPRLSSRSRGRSSGIISRIR